MDDRELADRLTRIYDEIVATRIDIELLKEGKEKEIEADRQRLKEEGETFEEEEQEEPEEQEEEEEKPTKITYKEQGKRLH